MLNALTVDVEEHFQVHNHEKVVLRSQWESYPSRVVQSTRRVLSLLESYRAHATFFVLGWVAERHPEIVREIAAAGHEIATHGYAHELIYRQTPDEFALDIARSLRVLREALDGDGSIWGYRAPAFSITRESLWALDVLKEHGIRYDSSIFPLAAHDRYGIPDAGRFASRIGNGLWEFPISTVRIARKNLPVAGGGYFRLLPAAATRLAIGRINGEGEPAVVYLHPWEFDPDQPRIPNPSRLARFRHYVNLRHTETKLRTLFDVGIKFGPMREVFAHKLEAGS